MTLDKLLDRVLVGLADLGNDADAARIEYGSIIVDFCDGQTVVAVLYIDRASARVGLSGNLPTWGWLGRAAAYKRAWQLVTMLGLSDAPTPGIGGEAMTVIGQGAEDRRIVTISDSGVAWQKLTRWDVQTGRQLPTPDWMQEDNAQWNPDLWDSEN